jgi:Predicted integral membrane protein (DUF2269)
MVKIARRWRLLLKGFHELFFILWIGGGVSGMAILSLTGNANDGNQLQGYYLAIQRTGLIIAFPSSVLTLVTGLLVTWLGGWGFRRFFVVYSLGIMIIAVVLGAVILNPAANTLANLSDTLGLQALQDPSYQQAIQPLLAVSIIEIVLLISAVFVCIFKPLKNLFSATKRQVVSQNIA